MSRSMDCQLSRMSNSAEYYNLHSLAYCQAQMAVTFPSSGSRHVVCCRCPSDSWPGGYHCVLLVQSKTCFAKLARRPLDVVLEVLGIMCYERKAWNGRQAVEGRLGEAQSQ